MVLPGVILSLFLFISVFTNNQYEFYNKLMWKKFHPVSSAGIWTSVFTHDH